MIPGALQDVGKLQSDKYEHQSIEDESQRIPNRICLQTHARRKKARASAAEVKSTRHDRQHPGCADRIGGEVGRIRSQDAEGDLYRSDVDTALDPVDDRSDQ